MHHKIIGMQFFKTDVFNRSRMFFLFSRTEPFFAEEFIFGEHVQTFGRQIKAGT